MKHLGAIANAGRSHLQTMCTLGQVLQERGHRFTLFATASQARQADFYNVSTVVLGPADPVADAFTRLENEQTLSMSAYLNYMKCMAAFLCEQAPGLLRRERVDFVLADQEEPGAATAADLAAIPYATICNSVPLNRDPWVPPSFVPWPGSSNFRTQAKNALAYTVRNFAVSGVHRAINAYRTAANLPLYRRPDDSFSRLAQITQLVRELDFPHKTDDPLLHYVGPYQRQPGREIPFAYEKLDGRPLIYASFGTSKGDVTPQFETIARACAALSFQLVISLGGGEVHEAYARFPGNPIVVGYAPQLELLSRAAVFITHGGVNSVMEGLSRGVPLIVLPRYGDQFGMAARVAYHRAGIALGTKSVNAADLRTSIERLAADPVYRDSALGMKQAIAQSNGAAEAADIIDMYAESRRPL
jgi:MGT family glycosyltransferase